MVFYERGELYRAGGAAAKPYLHCGLSLRAAIPTVPARMPTTPPLTPLGALRAFVRAGVFMGFVALAWIDYTWRMLRAAPAHRRFEQADWLHGWTPRILRLLSVSLEVRGTPPTTGLIVSNHLSYLDIFVLSAVTRCSFVAKSEIADWPVFGACARFCGTIFVDRERRGAVAGVAEKMREVLADGVPLVLFPESTSSTGAGVLPFKPALLAPVVELACPVTAVALDYDLPGGSAADEVCWGDGPIAPHVVNLFSKPTLRARVCWGAPQSPGEDRKALARELYAQVVALRE
jgi:1-acyl-sn-glycerol-3-phosphate acyltransferase